jgi:hypothetical protein
MAKVYKNDIFEVIKQIDNKNYDYYESLPKDKQDDIQPYTIMRWESSADRDDLNEVLTKNVNERVNKHFWELSKYKDLQWKLLCTCGMKRWVKHNWIPMSKSSTDKAFKTVREFYSNLNDEDFDIKYKSLEKNDIQEIFENLGLKDK